MCKQCNSLHKRFISLFFISFVIGKKVLGERALLCYKCKKQEEKGGTEQVVYNM